MKLQSIQISQVLHTKALSKTYLIQIFIGLRHVVALLNTIYCNIQPVLSVISNIQRSSEMRTLTPDVQIGYH